MNRREFLGAAVAVPVALASAARRDDRFEEMVRIIDASMREHGVPGVAFGVIKDGQIQLRSLGVTSVEDPRPVTDDTLFELASLSKTYNATAAMALVQQGKLELDVPVRKYLPDFRVEDDTASATLTLRHLLTQTAGFEARYNVEEGAGALSRWVPTMGDMIQLAPPGRVWSYCNPAAGLAGRLIEVASGLEIRDAFRALVFDPIGLPRSTAHITELVTWPLAVGHRPGPDGKAVVVRPYSMGSSIPAGGVNGSLRDLMRYIAFHLGEHDGTGKGVLTRATRTAMIQPQVRKEPTGEEMGIGFHLRTLNGVRTAAHSGSAGAGHRNHLQFVPERRLGIAILTNHTEGWRVRQAVEAPLLKTYEGLALTPNQPIVGYRGHTETLDHVTPLATQPSPTEYVGRYQQTRTSVIEVKASPAGGLLVGDARTPTEIRFYGPDLAVSLNGAAKGTSYNFIRDNGQVRWMRAEGQIARKES
jgi:CubicO group peptidase (beta-lactamase class C family)